MSLITPNSRCIGFTPTIFSHLRFQLKPDFVDQKLIYAGELLLHSISWLENILWVIIYWSFFFFWILCVHVTGNEKMITLKVQFWMTPSLSCKLIMVSYVLVYIILCKHIIHMITFKTKLGLYWICFWRYSKPASKNRIYVKYFFVLVISTDETRRGEWKWWVLSSLPPQNM